MRQHSILRLGLISLLFIFLFTNCNNEKSKLSELRIISQYPKFEKDSIILTSSQTYTIYTGIGFRVHKNESDFYYKLDSIQTGNYILSYTNIFNELVTDSLYIKDSIYTHFVNYSDISFFNEDINFFDSFKDTLRIIVSTINNGRITNNYKFWKHNNLFYQINNNKIFLASEKLKRFLSQFYQELILLSENKKGYKSTVYDSYLIIKDNDTTVIRDDDGLWHGCEKLFNHLHIVD